MAKHKHPNFRILYDVYRTAPNAYIVGIKGMFDDGTTYIQTVDNDPDPEKCCDKGEAFVAELRNRATPVKDGRKKLMAWKGEIINRPSPTRAPGR